MRRAVVALLAAVTPFAALAQAFEPRMQVELANEHSELDKGLADWRETTLRVSRQWAPSAGVEASITETRRFGLTDTQVGISVSAPLSPRLTATADATYSPTHRVLARHAAGTVLQYEFAPGWLVHGGARRTVYDDTRVHRGMLMLEHYFGDFSASAAWYPTRARDTSTNNLELRGSWYYGEGRSVGVIASKGDEAAPLGAGQIVLADVRSLALTGRHQLRPGLSLTWAAFQVRQGRFYTRNGASAGVRFSF